MAQIAHQSYLVSYFQRHTIHAWYGEREAPFPVRIKDDAAEVVTKWLMAETYPTRKLGPNGPSVSAIGLGAAVISGKFYGKADEAEASELLSYAADRGITFWDTAAYYGTSETIIGKWLEKTGRRSEIFLATKFGIIEREGEGPWASKICSEPSYIKHAIQESLEALQTTYIDLYYQHRVDPSVPIEIVLETLRPFVESGQIKWLGLSECSAATLRRAKAVSGIGEKVVAAQMEYSPFELRIEHNGLLAAANELGVAIVPYSPLGRGLITGRYKSLDDFEEGDLRRSNPRFSSENFPKNLELVSIFEKMGAKYYGTPGQIALSWILAQHPNFVPIPGTRAVSRLEENARSIDIRLSAEDIAAIRKRVEEADIVGGARSTAIPHGDCIKLADWNN